MTRKTTTVMLDRAECSGEAGHRIENVLRNVPGVLRAYVNPATEAAYIEYDADRCITYDLEVAMESINLDTRRPTTTRRPAVPLSPISSKRLPMRDTNSHSRTWWAFAGFIAIAVFFLFTEHRAHLFGILPFLFLLACPFLHMFGHDGHGGHGDNTRAPNEKHDEPSSSRGHQHAADATPHDRRN